MLSNRFSRVSGVSIALGLILAFAGQTAFAGTYTWTGGTTADWATANNWTNHAVPGGADIALFPGTSYNNQPNVGVAAAAGGLWDTGSAGVSIGGTGLTINGATINGNANTGVEMDSGAGGLTIGLAVSLGGTQTWLNNSSNLLNVLGTVDNGGNLLTVGGNGNSSFGGVISNTGGLVKSGSGMMVVSAANSFTGNIVINGGTLQNTNAIGGNGPTVGGLGNPQTAGRTVTINNSGVLSLNVPGGNAFGNGASAPQFGFVINAGGQLVNSYSGAANNTVGPITLNGGTLTTGQSVSTQYESFELGSTVTVSGSASSFINTSGTAFTGLNLGVNSAAGAQTTFNVGLTGSGGTVSSDPDLIISVPLANAGSSQNATGLIKTGPGIMALTGTSVYTSTTTISAGTLQLGNFGATGALSVSSSIADNGTLAFARNNTVTQGADFSNAVISGAGNLLQRGPGNLVLNLVNVYSGSNTITGGGTISVAANNFLGTGSAVTLDNGVMAFTAGLTSGRTFTITSNGGTVSAAGGNSTISGLVTGPGGLYVVSPGTTARVLTLGNATNSFSGGVTVSNSMLQIAADGMLGPVPAVPSTNITLVNGELFNNGGALTLSASRNIAVSGMGYVEAGWAPNLTTINGNIVNVSGGSGGFGVIWDAGTVVLNGANTYSGPTVIGTVGNGANYYNAFYAATLQLGSAAALPDTYVSFGVHPNHATNQAVLDLYGQSPSVLGLSGSGTNGVVNNSGGGLSTLTINGSGGLFSGLLENTKGTLGLVVNVTGVQSLGTGSYVGGTILSGGTLQAGSSSSFGAASNPLQVNGGVLDLYNNSVTVGQFTGSGGAITSGAGGSPVLTINNSSPSTYYGVIVNGAGGAGRPGLNVASSTLTLPNGSQADGPTSVGGGAQLILGSGASLGGSVGGALTLGSGVSGGTLVLGSGTSHVGGLFAGGSSTGNSIVEGYASNSTLVVNYNGATLDRFSERRRRSWREPE